MRPGDKVVATKDIGGFARERVPKGSLGVVVKTPWGSRTRVVFTVSSVWSGDKKIEIDVDKDEIA